MTDLMCMCVFVRVYAVCGWDVCLAVRAQYSHPHACPCTLPTILCLSQQPVTFQCWGLPWEWWCHHFKSALPVETTQLHQTHAIPSTDTVEWLSWLTVIVWSTKNKLASSLIWDFPPVLRLWSLQPVTSKSQRSLWPHCSVSTLRPARVGVFLSLSMGICVYMWKPMLVPKAFCTTEDKGQTHEQWNLTQKSRKVTSIAVLEATHTS